MQTRVLLSLTAGFLAFVTQVPTTGAFPAFSWNDINTWTRVNLSALDSDRDTRKYIAQKRQQLRTIGVAHFSDFLNEQVLARFQHEILGSPSVLRNAYRTIFQDSGSDLDEYRVWQGSTDKVHPRNRRFDNSMSFVPRRNVERTFVNSTVAMIQLFNSDQFTAMINAVAGFNHNNDNNNDDNSNIDHRLYRSADADGSVYGFIGRNGDWFTYHFDEHPFSCVFLLLRPAKGGRFRMVDMSRSAIAELYPGSEAGWPDMLQCDDEGSDEMDKKCEDKSDLFRTNRPWSVIDKLFDGDEKINEQVLTLDSVKEGDMYCFWGNESLHEITKIDDDKGYGFKRAVNVFTYSTVPNFGHTAHVYEMNDWGK